MSNEACAACGMPVKAPAYHPWAACELFKRCRSSATVEANIRAVVQYGHDAAKNGVSVATAMRNISAARPTTLDKPQSKEASL